MADNTNNGALAAAVLGVALASDESFNTDTDTTNTTTNTTENETEVEKSFNNDSSQDNDTKTDVDVGLKDVLNNKSTTDSHDNNSQDSSQDNDTKTDVDVGLNDVLNNKSTTDSHDNNSQDNHQNNSQDNDTKTDVDVGLNDVLNNKSANDSYNTQDNSQDNDTKTDVDVAVNDALNNKSVNGSYNDSHNDSHNDSSSHFDLDVDIKDSFNLTSYDNDWLDVSGSTLTGPLTLMDLHGDGNDNAFSISQVNSMVDSDAVSGVSVSSTGGWSIEDSHAYAGDGPIDGIDSNGAKIASDNAHDGLPTGTASADATVNTHAFTQDVVVGANIQYNSIDLSVVGGDHTIDNGA